MELQTITPILAIQGLPHFSLIDFIDILFVALLVYEIYMLVKGSNAMRIFWAIAIIVACYFIASFLHMRLSSAILGQVVSVGLIAIIIVFQQEIRRLLLLLGTKTTIAGDTTAKRFLFWKKDIATSAHTSFEPFLEACANMSASKTGALIIFTRQNDLSDIISTGERLNALASAALIENIFFKNTPLHDGALIVKGNTLIAARCILPVSSNSEIDPNLGLRHRAAIGMTEQNDSIAVVVSEETGSISYVVEGTIHHNVSLAQLSKYLKEVLE